MIHVELRYPIFGKTLPTDHGYALFAALSRLLPEAHDSDWLAVSTLPGLARGDGTLQLDPQATLKLRLPQDCVPVLLKLAGKRLNVAGHDLRLRPPRFSCCNRRQRSTPAASQSRSSPNQSRFWMRSAASSTKWAFAANPWVASAAWCALATIRLSGLRWRCTN